MSQKLVDIYATKEKKKPKRHKDKLRHVRIPLKDEYLKHVRQMARTEQKTVTDMTEELIQDILEREYVWQIRIIEDDYEAAAKHSVQAWLPPSAHDVLFDLAVEHLSSIRHVAYSLIVHALKGRGVRI